MASAAREPWIDEAEKVLSVPLTRHTREQAVGPCPFCGGTDRFVVWEKGTYWCRQCSRRGWWKEGDPSSTKDRKRPPPPRIEVDWLAWHDALLKESDLMDLLSGGGLSPDLIDKFGIGLARVYGQWAMTIPVFVGGELADIRLRRLDNSGGKWSWSGGGSRYRSLLAETPPQPFNVDSVSLDRRVLLVEGCKKAIILSDVHQAIVGIPGAFTFVRVWPAIRDRLQATQEVVFGFDPDMAFKLDPFLGLLRKEGINVRVVYFPLKPDDFLLRYGENVTRSFISMAEAVK